MDLILYFRSDPVLSSDFAVNFQRRLINIRNLILKFVTKLNLKLLCYSKVHIKRSGFVIFAFVSILYLYPYCICIRTVFVF